MPIDYEEIVEAADQIRDSIALENVLSPIQARSFVRALQTSWHVQTINWRESETGSQLADARRLIHTAEIYRTTQGVDSENALLCFRRAGELLEWLTRSMDRTDSSVSIALLAGAAYQLGGLPAMASGLVTLSEMDDPGSALFAAFLGANFDEVISIVSGFWIENFDLAVQDASQQLLAGEGGADFSWHFVVETVRSLGLIADSLRRGNEDRLALAIKKLEKLDSLATRTAPEDVSLLITLALAVATDYRRSSIHNRLNQLAELNSPYRARLARYGRVQYNRGRGILWASQECGFDKLLQDSSFALCTPTGSGKTLIANLAIIKELLLKDQDGIEPLALYLVPSRALAGEVEAKLTSELGDDFVITGLYGGSDWGITDYWLDADKPTVLIATVEKADALMRYLGRFLVSRLKLLIIDEAHQVVSDGSENARTEFAEHGSRSLRLESLVSRIINMSPDIVRVALTAVAGGAALPVSKWIEGSYNAQPVGTNYRSTRQVIGTLETSPGTSGRFLLELMNDRTLFVRGRGEAVYINLTIPAMPQLPAAMRNSVNRFNQLSTLWTALHLVEGDRRILISLAQQPERTMGWFVEALNLVGWREIQLFDPPEDGDLRNRFEETCMAVADYCGNDSYELALLERGIATNHGQMPQRIRRLMTFLIEHRVCPVTVATATLTEGVNLPFDLIFLTSLKRQYYDPLREEQVVKPFSTSEFRNLAGRAGRPGATDSMEGLTLVAVPQKPSTTANRQRPAQRRQVGEFKADYESLIRRLTEEGDQNHATIPPLALLLVAIYERFQSLYPGGQESEFLVWLEHTAPQDISIEAGTGSHSDEALLADTLDELDGFLLSAVEELTNFSDAEVSRQELEGFLRALWGRTFTKVVINQENMLERSFIKRGQSLVETIYPDSNERARLYQYGFSPYVGKLFEVIESGIKDVLSDAEDYGSFDQDGRISKFFEIGDFLVGNSGFGFRVRASDTEVALLKDWKTILAWWMNFDGAEPPGPKDLRRWQRFVSENLDFRLGVAIGAVVAKAWSDGADDPFDIPSLVTWRETTGLPWFGFWAKELLRWGTLDPFVAFALSRGLARTREEAADRRPEFEAWLEEQEDLDEQGSVIERLIDPQLFLAWQSSLAPPQRRRRKSESGEVELTGTTGQRGKYSVIPLTIDQELHWIDSSGYALAKSEQIPSWVHEFSYKEDFEIEVEGEEAIVRRIFGSV